MKSLPPVFAAAVVGIAFVCFPCAPLALGAAPKPEKFEYLPTLPKAPANRNYVGSQPPLAPSPLQKLPAGSIRPQGWLAQQLRLEADGFTGHLPELSRFCKFANSAWANPRGEGEYGWEELPYWLRGAVSLAWAADDQPLRQETQRWIDAILASQQTNGWFGPVTNLATPDLWPNMLALYALRTHHEATGDPRVVPFMKRYFGWMRTLPAEQVLPGSWQKIRGADNLDSIYWLYNQTREPWLLDLARLNHERTAPWKLGVVSWHGVNIAQGFREPAQFFQQSLNRKDLEASRRNLDEVLLKYGQVPGGLYGADENARQGYNGPRQGTEACTMAELLWSYEKLLSITGDGGWADSAEQVAFNSLPASMTPDLKGLHYLTCPNQVQLDRQNKAPMIENDGDMFSYNPHQYRCCQHNLGFAWPYFNEHLWMATAGHGLAATLYSPSKVTARVGHGALVHIVEDTSYPFDDTITFSFQPPEPVEFPFLLRIPGWCAAPEVTVNREPTQTFLRQGRWISLNRTWQSGDQVRLRLPMAVRTDLWPENRMTASLALGPLTFSLRIEERWQSYGDSPQWPAFEVFPASPWNYGLYLDPRKPASAVRVSRKIGPVPKQPFTLDGSPVTLRVPVRPIPGWGMETNGLIQEVRQGPLRSLEPTREVTLVPMGCARLRLTAFPLIDLGPAGKE